MEVIELVNPKSGRALMKIIKGIRYPEARYVQEALSTNEGSSLLYNVGHRGLRTPALDIVVYFGEEELSLGVSEDGVYSAIGVDNYRWSSPRAMTDIPVQAKANALRIFVHEIRKALQQPTGTNLVKATCPICDGTGVYQTGHERPGVGAICSHCKGEGFQLLEYTPFTTRRQTRNIVVVRPDFDVLSRKNGQQPIAITYTQFLQGKRPGYESK